MKSGHGSLRTKRTRPGSTIWTSRTRSLRSLAPRAPVALEGELHVLRGHRLAVVELARPCAARTRTSSPSFDCVHDSARLGRVDARRHRLHERVVDRVEHHERRDDALGLRGIEPARGQRDVHAPGHGAFRSGARRTGGSERECDEEQKQAAPSRDSHVLPFHGVGTGHFRDHCLVTGDLALATAGQSRRVLQGVLPAGCVLHKWRNAETGTDSVRRRPKRSGSGSSSGSRLTSNPGSCARV